jgi:hypothetical protein
MATSSETLHSIIDQAPSSAFLLINDTISGPILQREVLQVLRRGRYLAGTAETVSQFIRGHHDEWTARAWFYSIRPSVLLKLTEDLYTQETIQFSMGELLYPHILSRKSQAMRAKSHY